MDYEGLRDLMQRQRAVRMIDTSRPVDEETVEELLRAATYAPNGGNRQLWRFVVIRDADVKAKLSAVYDGLADERYHNGDRRTPWTDVPVLIAFCSDRRVDAGASTSPSGASVYPAVQNLLLAAHTLGLGSVLTTLWKADEAPVRAALNLPDDVEVHAILPIGWRDRKYGRNKRRPIAEVAYRDRYGEAW